MHVWDGNTQPILHDPTAPKTGGTTLILPLYARKRKGILEAMEQSMCIFRFGTGL